MGVFTVVVIRHFRGVFRFLENVASEKDDAINM